MAVRMPSNEDYKGPTISITLRSEVCCGETKAWLSYGSVTAHLATGLATFHSYHNPDNLREKIDVRTPLRETEFTEAEKQQILKLMEAVYESIFGDDKKT